MNLIWYIVLGHSNMNTTSVCLYIWYIVNTLHISHVKKAIPLWILHWRIEISMLVLKHGKILCEVGEEQDQHNYPAGSSTHNPVCKGDCATLTFQFVINITSCKVAVLVFEIVNVKVYIDNRRVWSTRCVLQVKSNRIILLCDLTCLMV